MTFKTYIVGRGGNSDILLQEASVSRVHAEITVITGSSHAFLIDRNSSAGCRMKLDGKWQAFEQGFVAMTDTIGFGKLEIKVSELIAKLTPAQKKVSIPYFEPVSVRPRRNVETGQIEE